MRQYETRIFYSSSKKKRKGAQLYWIPIDSFSYLVLAYTFITLIHTITLLPFFFCLTRQAFQFIPNGFFKFLLFSIPNYQISENQIVPIDIENERWVIFPPFHIVKFSKYFSVSNVRLYAFIGPKSFAGSRTYSLVLQSLWKEIRRSEWDVWKNGYKKRYLTSSWCHCNDDGIQWNRPLKTLHKGKESRMMWEIGSLRISFDLLLSCSLTLCSHASC